MHYKRCFSVIEIFNVSIKRPTPPRPRQVVENIRGHLGDEGGHGPLHDPLGEPLVEDGPHLAPVPGLGPAPVAPSSAAGHDGQGQQGALGASASSASAAGASAGVSPQQPRDGADAAPQQGA